MQLEYTLEDGQYILKEGTRIDKGILGAVEYFNNSGIETFTSCQGDSFNGQGGFNTPTVGFYGEYKNAESIFAHLDTLLMFLGIGPDDYVVKYYTGPSILYLERDCKDEDFPTRANMWYVESAKLLDHPIGKYRRDRLEILLNDYSKSYNALTDYFGDLRNHHYYIYQEINEDYWSIDGDNISWGPEKFSIDGELDKEPMYSEQIRYNLFHRGSDYTIVLIDGGGYGEGHYWDIFRNSKEVKS